jgi:hypothetical protein
MSAPVADADVLTDYARTVNDLDSSRRVGWAKMYAALAAGEKAERELAIAREDIALLSKFAGFTFGALQSLGLRDIYHTYLKGDLDQLQSYLPNGAINMGRNVGQGWREGWIARLADKTAMYEARAKAQAANEKQMAAARYLVREELAEEFGFATVDELRDYLSHRRAS